MANLKSNCVLLDKVPSCWCTSLHLKRTLFNDYSFSKNAGLLNVLKAVMKFADITAAARMTPTDHPATL